MKSSDFSHCIFAVFTASCDCATSHPASLASGVIDVRSALIDS